MEVAAANKLGSVILGLRATNESDYTHSKRFCDNGLLSVRYNRAPLIANQQRAHHVAGRPVRLRLPARRTWTCRRG